MSNRSIDPSPFNGGDFGNIVGFGLLIFAGWVLWSLFVLSIALGIGALAFVAVCIYLMTQLGALEDQQTVLVGGLLVLAILGALLLHPLAIENRIVPFALAGWTITGLFYASLIAGAWVVASALGRILAMIVGAVAVGAMLILPAPRGSADPTDKASEWRITLTVLDEKGQAMHLAVAQCSAAMFWDDEGPVKFDSMFARTTDEEGEAVFTFHDDTRLRVAVCTALRVDEAGAGWMEPDEDEFARALYPPKSVAMASPLPGGDYKLTLKLEPRTQPDDQAARR